MSETMWMMDSEFCSECGAILDYFESDLCFDCREDEYDEDRERDRAWEDWQEEEREA
jgi:hypothetical protein